MSDLTSRVLGPIDLDGGPGGGAMECDVPFGSRLVPTRLEIDYPGRLSQKMIEDLDIVLEHLDIPDRLAREAIARAVLRDGTAPHSLFTSWAGRTAVGTEDVDSFVAALRPMHMLITPDGGRVNRDRVVLRYGLDGATDEVTVRLPSSPTGPEIDRTLRRAG
ncbi:hypothetical protein [Microbacterium testaceum]|uniref:hypothetical protein n=1 Tax=Microbacterium testaceum TaxID=2033 RepID=UPI001244328B|nr:hypothetical protein [Microbacterium testaceum]